MEIRAFTPKEMEHLLSVDAPIYVSLYLHLDTATLKGKMTRANKLLRAAQAGLTAHHWQETESGALLAPLHGYFENSDFWRGRRGSIVIFRTPTECNVYQVPLGLQERVVVGHQFFIKPLLPLVTWDRPFYVLAVSQHSVRLLQCSYDDVHEIKVKGMPRNLEDALKDQEPEKQHQIRSVGPSFGTGRGMAIRYGEGGGQEEHKARLERYLRMVDAAVHHALANAHAPMVFAGVEYLFPMYQQITAYPQLHKLALKGNPDRLRDETLHTRARELLRSYLDEPKCAALEQFRILHESNRTFSEMESIVKAAQQGRIQALFIDRQAEEWGEFDKGTPQVIYHPRAGSDGNEISNLAAILTLRQKGQVFALDTPEMPTQSAMAVLRY